MNVLITCKNKEDPIKHERANLATTFFPLKDNRFFSRRGKSAVRGLNKPNFELIRDFMGVPVTCKIEEHSIQNEGS